MKIIDIGVCIDNNDPKGIGRVRYKPRGLFQSEIEKSAPYEQWDENDPFILIPFLPLHINVIPQVQQSVKIVRYDTDKVTQNSEYIAGPFASPHDLQNQTFLQQHRDTTYGGNTVKDIKDIREKNGTLKNKLSEGTLIKNTDNGIKGNYGSDIIFTENGLQIRGGMLVSKDNGNKKTNLDFPIMSKKMGRFTLKKFQKTMELKEEIETQISVPVQRINYIIEYETNSITNPTLVNFFIYRIVDGYGNQFNSNVFDNNTDITNTDIKSKLKLINTGNTENDPTFSVSIDGTLKMAYITIRSFLYDFYENKVDLSQYDYYNNKTLNNVIFPFYFRPSDNFKKTYTDITPIINNVSLRNKIGDGLIFSHNKVDPDPIETNIKTTKLKQINSSTEQSFSSLSADKIYLTSTSTNGTENIKVINFDILDKYDLTQEDYLKNIDPNTYSMVRGEILLNLLRSIRESLFSHVHNINKPPVKSDPNLVEFDRLMNTLENELLNKSIRIN